MYRRLRCSLSNRSMCELRWHEYNTKPEEVKSPLTNLGHNGMGSVRGGWEGKEEREGFEGVMVEEEDKAKENSFRVWVKKCDTVM
ncbi:hypothetical protein GOBAR_AA05785 [Gossypium barbadense]|uniref:Uncharacterized protein n=1 Tax=Gossypium barbadense TaxID=3634 RepID=A0A2P5YGU3_GOSBA|nr:hypothetical protein GOBAR_AA05785 [Gossypium barbadense]